MTTLRDMVFDAREQLEGGNVGRYATFKQWTLDSGGNKVGLQLGNTQFKLNNTLVELDTELAYISSIDASGHATCPPWFRQQGGTPANDSFAPNSRVTIAPQWPTYRLAQKVTEGVAALYPSLFAVKEVDLATSIVNGNYVLPDDVDGILRVTQENIGPGKEQVPLERFSLDTANTDGLNYLRTSPSWPGRPLRVTYRARPVVPDPTILSTTWASTGLPDSAKDLPVKYAVLALLPSVDASKTQLSSMEQSDRSKYVQAGSANATSRRLQEIYLARLSDERRKLTERYPVRIHKELSG